MKSVNVHEAKSTLSALLSAVEERGEVYVICRAGKPIAELRRVSSRPTVAPDPLLSRIELVDDPTTTLSPAEWGELA